MTLHRDDIEAIAERVAELVADSAAAVQRKADVAAIADEYAVSPDWVRDHAGELGAIRIGDGPRGELRFDRREVARAMERRRVARAHQPAPRRRPGRAVGAASYERDVSKW